MSSEPDPEKLRALDERLAKLKGQPKAKEATAATGFSQGEIAWRMVIELASGIIVGTGIGYGLDYLFGTLPIFLVIFSVLGFIAGVRSLMATARAMQEKNVAQAAAQDTADHSAKDEG